MQRGFDDRIDTHFVNAQLRGDAGEVETVEVRNRNLKPGGQTTRIGRRSSRYAAIPHGLQVRRQVGGEVEAIADILDTINIIDACTFMQD